MVRVPHVTIRDAFGPVFAGGLFAHVIAREERMREAEVGGRIQGVDRAVRRALVLPRAGEAGDGLVARLEPLIPDVARRLGIGPFVRSGPEVSFVAYADGAFYSKHIDTAVKQSGDRPVRQITFVYYFFREPKGFAGGELRLYDLRQREHVDVGPERDLLVAFPSWLSHEVLPVRCPGGAFADGRFAANVWITGRMGSAVDA